MVTPNNFTVLVPVFYILQSESMFVQLPEISSLHLSEFIFMKLFSNHVIAILDSFSNVSIMKSKLLSRTCDNIISEITNTTINLKQRN